MHHPLSTRNPYQALLFAATSQAGSRCQALSGGVVQLLKFVLRRTDCTVLHLHWIGEPLAGPRLAAALARLLVFQLALVLWRLRGRCIVWTVHNLRDHGGRRPWLDRLNATLVARLASLLIVHGPSVRGLVATTFQVPLRKIRVIPHGHYGSIVQAVPIDPSHAGKRLLFFGQMRGYKGLPRLLQAFSQIQGRHCLRLAGSLTDPALARTLQDMAARDARVSVLAGHQSDAALAQLLAWCDAVVLPYDDVLTSGSLLMAMTAGRATVAPRTGVVADYADGGVHFLYDPQAPAGLQQALQQVVDAQDLAARGAWAGQQARHFDWATIGRQTAAVYCEATGQTAAAPAHEA